MTKKITWVCLVNGVLWVWCSYVLAFLDKTDIAQSLSITAITEIIGVVLVYCAKALLEKRDDFGAVGAPKQENGPQEGNDENG